VRRLVPWVLVCLLAVAACDDSEPRSAPSVSSTSPTVATSASTTVSSTTTTAAPAAQAKEFGAGAFVEGDDRWLTAPLEPSSKQLGSGCKSLADAGWESTCEVVSSQGVPNEAFWVHERKGVQERVLIYVNHANGGLDLALRAADDNGKEFDATVQTVDLAGDGTRKILVTLRSADQDTSDGISPFPQVDVVEPTGKIVVHVVMRGGRSGMPDAKAVPGRGLEIRDCPVDCLPTAPLRVRMISYRAGAWQVIDEHPEEP
jgi:hypothetical protein